MRVLITGSRSWNDVETIADVMKKFKPGTVVIHGAARGADTIAHVVAEEMGLKVVQFPLHDDDWKKFGLGAGPRRNRQMLEEGKPDIVIGFLDSFSTTGGTENMLHLAEEAGVKTLVIRKNCWPERCSTCNESYTPIPTDRAVICSNSFHCCRACTWVDGRVTVSCDRHAKDPMTP